MRGGGTTDRDGYERLRAAHLKQVAAALEDHLARIEWPRERIERYRTARLRALLAYARERSSFHAARLSGLDPGSATVADLAHVPPMTKRDAQDHWDSIVTAADLDRAGAERILATQRWFSYTASGEQVFSSGGSSGVRGIYVWDWQQFVTLACLAWRMQARTQLLTPRAGNDRAVLAVLAAGEPPHASTPLFDIPTAIGMRTVVIAAGNAFDQVLAEVADARPTHLVGYASVIGRLARASSSGRLDVHPVRVSTNSEPLTEEDREAIQAAWQAPVHNLWGSTEIGVQAVGCALGEGLHICEDEVILERVDEAGAPVADDQPAARTLATGLAGSTFPFIRYDLGDQITMLPGDCPCGSSLARIADVAGRRDDDLVYGAVTVPASSFRYVLGTDPAISEYQVIQTQSGAEVLVVGSPELAAVSTSLVAAMQKHGLADPEIRVREVPRIERNAASGKLRRFVPLPRGSD